MLPQPSLGHAHDIVSPGSDPHRIDFGTVGLTVAQDAAAHVYTSDVAPREGV